MASFQFRLAPVLRVRERIQEEKESELRALNFDRARCARALTALVAELNQLGVDLEAQMGRIVLPIELKLSDAHAQLLIGNIERKQRELAMLEELAERKRQELIEATRDVKSLELLRDRLEEKFRRAQHRAEQHFLDDFGQRRWSRGSGRQ